MLKFKKIVAILGVALMMAQGLPGLNPNNKAEAATYDPAMQELMSRPYPRVAGNQWHISPDGSIYAGDTANKINFAARYLDFVSVNRAGGGMNDLFLDFFQSTHDPSKGLLKFRNDLYNAASSAGRRVYVLAYHNMSDVWYYESATTFPNENFWMKPDGQNIGTWDYMEKYNYWYRGSTGDIVPYPGYSSTQRRMFDSRRAEVQEYWAQHAKGITDQGFDGIFSDNWLRSGFAGNDREGIQRGWDATGARFKQIAPNKMLLGNSPPYGPFTSRDICMLEDRIDDDLDGDTSIPSYFNYSDQAALSNQVCFDTYWNETRGPFDTFRVPMNLLTDNILGLTLNTQQGSSLDHQRIFIEKLGKIGYPKGPRYRANGVLQRDFDLAKVIVNDTASPVTITLPAGYKDLDGRSVSSVTLAAFRGTILRTNGVVTPPPPPPPTPTAPSAPSGLGVSITRAAAGNYVASLSWTDNSNNETGFKVLQSVNSTSNYQVVQTLGSNVGSTSVDLGLNPGSGSFNYQVLAVNAVGDSQPSNTASAQIQISNVPAAPSDLVLTGVSKGATTGNYYVNLTWRDNSSNETGFKILQSINSTNNFQVVKTPAANGTGYGINLGSNPTTGTYYYKIVAVNQDGDSQPSNTVTGEIGVVTPPPPTPTAPSAPSGLTVSITKAAAGNYVASLSWTDNSNNETGFKVLQAVNSTSNYQVAQTIGANIGSTSIDLGMSPTSGSYNYQVIAVNTVGDSQPSNTANAEIQIITIPTAPSNLAVAGVSKGATTGKYYVNLTWTDNSNNETEFKVLQSINSTSNYQVVQTLGSNIGSTSVDIGLNPTSGSYNYQVVAVNSAGDSQPSNTANTPIQILNVPAAPSDLVLTGVSKGATTGNYFVNLTWRDNSDNETGFEILQSINSTNNFQIVKTPAANGTGYGINLGSNPTTGTYYYKIVAVNQDGKSQPSNTVTGEIGVVTPPPTPTPPSAPSGLTTMVGKDVAGNSVIILIWQDTSNNEQGFNLYLSNSATGAFSKVGVFGANQTVVVHNVGTATTGTMFYQVKAFNSDGESAASNTGSATVN